MWHHGIFTCMCQCTCRCDINYSSPCTGAREAAFRNIKSIAECLADELINAAKVSVTSPMPSFAITFLFEGGCSGVKVNPLHDPLYLTTV